MTDDYHELGRQHALAKKSINDLEKVPQVHRNAWLCGWIETRLKIRQAERGKGGLKILEYLSEGQ